jgi:dienelactone hydrolase
VTADEVVTMIEALPRGTHAQVGPDQVVGARGGWAIARRSGAIGLRGAASGALLVTLGAAAVAAQNFHLLGWLGDGLLGALLISAPMALLAGVAGAVRWLVRRLVRSLRPGFRLEGRVEAVVAIACHPLAATTTCILAILTLGRDSGPLAALSAIIPFEIPIGTGAAVGLALGLAIGLGSTASASRLRRSVAVALATVAVVGGAAMSAWVVSPGAGSPIVRDPADSLTAIPPLDLPDPSVRGPHAVVAASYGSGTHRRREEYGTRATWITPTVDASTVIRRPPGIPSLYAQALWGYDTDRLPLDGLVWYAGDASGPMPVVLIAHGNHSAGESSDPGYAYLAEHLASHGMFAVSVDENFLNGDPFHDFGGTEMGLRAWLLLRHLEQLRAWNADPHHVLAGRLDLDRVALIGHSRGGEAAALAASIAAGDVEVTTMPDVSGPFGVKAVVAFAPSESMYRGPGSPIVLRDIDYLVVQGAHDGDLPWYEGLRTYHRVRFSGTGDHLKVAAYSERANHGRFNSVWDTGDAGPLASWVLDRGSLLSAGEQQRLAQGLVTAFLARSLEDETSYEAFFREPRAGRAWLPDDVVLTHWESEARVDVVELGDERPEDVGIVATGFTRIVRQDPRLRDATMQGDPALRLEWDRPASLTVPIDRAVSSRVEKDGQLVLSLVSEDETDVPAPDLVLTDGDGDAAVVSMAALSPMRPPLPTRLWKLDELGARYAPTEIIRWPAERFAQTYALDLAAFAVAQPGLDVTDLRSIEIRFSGHGAAFIDDLAFEPAVVR